MPPAALLQVPPSQLAASAVAVLRRVYSVELDYTRASLDRLDTLFAERFSVAQYTPETYPRMLALVVGAYVGEVLLRLVADGHWGTPEENLYRTPLPFLLFDRAEYARQINVIEDMCIHLWAGTVLPPGRYVDEHVTNLTRIGFTCK